MEIKSYADIRSLHTKFAKEVEKQRADLRKKLPKTPDGLLKVMQAQLDAAKKAATKCKRARTRVLKRFDAQIADLGKEADRLEREIRELEKSLGAKPKPKRGKRKKL